MAHRLALTFSAALLLSACSPLDAQDIPATTDDELRASKDDNLALGNPSDASTGDRDNYLLKHAQYALSYNDQKGTPNWVSWHLSRAWEGSTPRQDDFRADSTLPAGFKTVAPSWYDGSGYDMGHMCPSDDRTDSVADNQGTFFMTNMVPQAPDNNRVTWKALEVYSRKLVSNGNELYVVAGPLGQGGTGANGHSTSLHGGDVVVPESTWKVIVVLPVGAHDLTRVTASTRVIAVLMPNTQAVDQRPWSDYRVSVHELEQLTGFTFFPSVPARIAKTLKAGVDNGAVD